MTSALQSGSRRHLGGCSGLALWCCGFLAIYTAGCGGGGAARAPSGSLQGELTFDGKPVKSGQVVLHNLAKDAPKPNPIFITVNNGTFTRGDVPSGKYKVYITPSNADGKADDIPQKYREEETSGLETEVKAGTENKFSIDMTK